MASTSPAEAAARIVEICIAGDAVPDELLLPLAEQAVGEGPEALAASAALFSGIAEPLADRFEPALCDAYVDLFSRVLAMVEGGSSSELRARYARVRVRRRWQGAAPDRVVVLSRVTLGADIAITSVVLDALKRRFPHAEILLAGGRKSWELFAADPRIGHLEVRYGRSGSLRDRLDAGRRLRELVNGSGGLVVDPDSRLTQLGVLPVCDEENYCFFESRSAGGESDRSLSELTAEWVWEVFGLEGAAPYIAPARKGESRTGGIAVSYGVGENPGKRIPDPFESELLRGLLRMGLPVLIDRGPGGEEAERVERAVRDSGAVTGQLELFDGPFAEFATRIAGSRLFVGYDSAGQHAAAATGTASVSVFAGYPCKRFFHRWAPPGRAATTVRFGNGAPRMTVREVLAAVERRLGVAGNCLGERGRHGESGA